MRRAASLSEQPESTKAKARRRRSSSRSALPFGLGIGVQAEKQSTYIIGFFLEESYYILYTLLNIIARKALSFSPLTQAGWADSSRIECVPFESAA